VLRVPRRGGVAHVTAFPAVDSVVWTSGDALPAIDHVLAFDDDAGLLAFVDGRGIPWRLDFRVGSLTPATKTRLRALASMDAATIYGVGPDGAVVRLTPEGLWTFKPPRSARGIFPQRDGSALVLGTAADGSTLWRVHPPDSRVGDSLSLPIVTRAVATSLGDRVYVVTSDDELIGVGARRLNRGPPIRLRGPVVAAASTPSGDRLYVALDATPRLSVVNRYQDRIVAQVDLPATARDLRIDPLGRYLLVRAATGDSVWVLATATNRVTTTLRTAWRDDLPFVSADGTIGLAAGSDVLLVDAETGRERGRASGGANDFWFPFLWSGFRPRAAALDQPVQFAGPDSADTTKLPPRPVRESTVVRPPPADTIGHGFVVSFAALLSESRARERAAEIRVRGQTARVVASQREGTTVYRVILGPYPTREDAERIGRESGQSYWVFEGAP
jgi:hypothetical protein